VVHSRGWRGFLLGSEAAYAWKSRHGIYYLRCVIPEALRPLFGHRRELRRSLGTDSRRAAVRRARAYRVDIDKLMDQWSDPAPEWRVQ